MANIPSNDIQPRNGIFPDLENIPKVEKQTAEYCRNIAKAFFTQYSTDKGGVPYSGVDDFIDGLRRIASGRQSPELYKDILLGTSPFQQNVMDDYDDTLDAHATTSREGWMTGLEHVASPIPNLMTQLLAQFLRYETDIKAYCVDSDSNTEEIRRMNGEWVKNMPIFNFLRKNIGLPEKRDVITDSYEALVDIKKEGGFKDRVVIGVEESIKHTADISEWETSLGEKLFKDIITLSSAVAINDYDETEHKVRWKYIDIKNFGCQYSLEKDFSDCQAIYWFDYPSLNYIRTIQDRITDGKKTGLTSDDIINIANSYKSYSTNASSPFYEKLKYFNDRDQNNIDVDVCVMHLRWLDVEKEKTSEYTNKGKTSIVPYAEGHEKERKYNVIENRKIRSYDTEWLVGTEFVWNFGKAKNQSDKPSLDFAAYKLHEKSIIERIVHIAHLFAVSWDKFVNDVKEAQADFFVFDASQMAVLTDGGKKYDPLEIIKMIRQKYVGFYQGTTDNRGGDNFPVKNYLGTSLESIMKQLNIQVQLLKQVEILTGIPLSMLGGAPEARTPSGPMMESIQSSNVALNFLMNATSIVKKKLAENTIPMLSNLFEVDEQAVKIYSNIIGEDDVDAIRQNRGKLANLGIKLRARPSKELIQSFREYIQVSIANKELDGGKGIRILYQLDHGEDFLQLIYKVDYWIREEKKRVQADKMALMKQQSDGNIAAQHQASVDNRDTMVTKMKFDDNKQKAKANYQTIMEGEKFANKIKELVIKDKQEKGEDPVQTVAEIQVMVDEFKKQLVLQEQNV